MTSLSWMRGLAPLIAGAIIAGSAGAATQAPPYPSPHRDNTVDHYFGTKVPAPYQWMEQLDSPKLKSWVAKENKLTAKRISAFAGHDWIHQRLTTLQDVPSETVPIAAGNVLFYRRNQGLQDQSVLKMQKLGGHADHKAQTLLDPNTLSKDGQIALLSYQPSDNGKHVVYGLSQGGSDWETLHVLDTATGKTTNDAIHWVKFSNLSWTHDGKGFFYSRYPKPEKGHDIADKVSVQSLYYHKLGTPQSADKLIFKRPKKSGWVVGGQVSDDGRYLYISFNKGTLENNELFVVDMGKAGHPNVTAKPKPLFTDNDAKYQPIGHDGQTFYLLTNRNAKKGKIVSFSLDQPKPANWKTVVPEGDSVIQSAAMAGGRLLVNRLVDVKSKVAVYNTAGKKIGTLPTPGIGSVGAVHAKNERDTVYYSFNSFLSPGSILRYNVASGKKHTVFKPNVPFDASKYVTDQVFYHSKDGTRVPMFIVHAKGMKRNGSHPTLLYGYGGFDITITPHFSKSVATWLDMGGVYAVANLRGGGAYGEAWHHAGMKSHKQNVFDDFAAAAHYLINKNYTSKSHLGIEGYSNGGLLVGASITQHPDLFGAAYAGAGVQDVLRYQKFSGGGLWAPEYGTSDNKKAFDWLIKYSPLANVKNSTCYPPTILTTADHDDRVVPSHTYKFAAKLQHAQANAKGCHNPILLRVDTQTSHNYMPTNKRIDRTADVLSFMAMHLGATAPEASHKSANNPHDAQKHEGGDANNRS